MTAEYLTKNPFVDGDRRNPCLNFMDAEILQLPTNIPLDKQLARNLYLDTHGGRSLSRSLTTESNAISSTQ